MFYKTLGKFTQDFKGIWSLEDFEVYKEILAYLQIVGMV